MQSAKLLASPETVCQNLHQSCMSSSTALQHVLYVSLDTTLEVLVLLQLALWTIWAHVMFVQQLGKCCSRGQVNPIAVHIVEMRTLHERMRDLACQV